MGALLLAALLTLPVAFPGGQTIQVPLPENDPASVERPLPPEILFNPQNLFAIVKLCWSAGAKYQNCDFVLVDAESGIRHLSQASVRGLPHLFWTPDGKYLIAQGDTWVRLWNLNGKVRGVTPNLEVSADQTLLNRYVEETKLEGRFICAITGFSVGKTADFQPLNDLRVNPYNLPPPKITLLWTATKYNWPTLQRISQTMPSEIKPTNCL